MATSAYGSPCFGLIGRYLCRSVHEIVCAPVSASRSTFSLSTRRAYRQGLCPQEKPFTSSITRYGLLVGLRACSASSSTLAPWRAYSSSTMTGMHFSLVRQWRSAARRSGGFIPSHVISHTTPRDAMPTKIAEAVRTFAAGSRSRRAHGQADRGLAEQVPGVAVAFLLHEAVPREGPPPFDPGVLRDDAARHHVELRAVPPQADEDVDVAPRP